MIKLWTIVLKFIPTLFNNLDAYETEYKYGSGFIESSLMKQGMKFYF